MDETSATLNFHKRKSSFRIEENWIFFAGINFVNLPKIHENTKCKLHTVVLFDIRQVSSYILQPLPIFGHFPRTDLFYTSLSRHFPNITILRPDFPDWTSPLPPGILDIFGHCLVEKKCLIRIDFLQGL